MFLLLTGFCISLVCMPNYILLVPSCFVLVGDMFHKATSFRIVVDGIVVSSEIATPLAAFGLLFGMYFLLNISYPSAVGATLEYVQRLLCNFNFILFNLKISIVAYCLIKLQGPQREILILHFINFILLLNMKSCC